MANKITSEGLEKLKALIEKKILKKGKADKLRETIKNLKDQKVAEAVAKAEEVAEKNILTVLMEYLISINPDCDIEEMLANYETHIERLEALIDELAKCLREHYAKYLPNAEKTITVEPGKGKGRP